MFRVVHMKTEEEKGTVNRHTYMCVHNARTTDIHASPQCTHNNMDKLRSTSDKHHAIIYSTARYKFVLPWSVHNIYSAWTAATEQIIVDKELLYSMSFLALK